MGVGLLAKILSGSYAKKNDNMPGSSILLQVEATEGDVENVELFHAAGVAARPVAGGFVALVPQGRGRAAVAVHDYRTTFDLADGEAALYSTDANGALKASVVMRADGTIEINGSAKHFVTWEGLDAAMNTALNGYVAKLNIALLTGANGGGPVVFATSPPSSIDLSGAKSTTLKTGG